MRSIEQGGFISFGFASFDQKNSSKHVQVKIFEASLIYYTSGRAVGQAEGGRDGLHFYGWVNEQAVDLLKCCEQLSSVIFYLQKFILNHLLFRIPQSLQEGHVAVVQQWWARSLEYLCGRSNKSKYCTCRGSPGSYERERYVKREGQRELLRERS